MAIHDVLTRVSSDQPLTGGGLFLSDKSWDVSTGGDSRLRDILRGNPIACRLQVTEAFVSAGASLLVPYLTLAQNSDLTGIQILVPLVAADSSQAVAIALGGLAGISKGDLTLGAEFAFILPKIPDTLLDTTLGRRYLGMTYVITVANFTAGKVTVDFGHHFGGNTPPIFGIGYAGP